MAEAERQELEEFKEACLLPKTEGVAFATDKLAAVQASVKEQFKDVFLELKEALEVRPFMFRSRFLCSGLKKIQLTYTRTPSLVCTHDLFRAAPGHSPW